MTYDETGKVITITTTIITKRLLILQGNLRNNFCKFCPAQSWSLWFLWWNWGVCLLRILPQCVSLLLCRTLHRSRSPSRRCLVLQWMPSEKGCFFVYFFFFFKEIAQQICKTAACALSRNLQRKWEQFWAQFCLGLLPEILRPSLSLIMSKPILMTVIHFPCFLCFLVYFLVVSLLILISFFSQFHQILKQEHIEKITRRIPTKSLLLTFDLHTATIWNNRMKQFQLHQFLRKFQNSSFCFVCRGTQMKATLYGCDYCPLSFHLDCIDPPISHPPNPAIKWMCPNHADRFLVFMRMKMLSPVLVFFLFSHIYLCAFW